MAILLERWCDQNKIKCIGYQTFMSIVIKLLEFVEIINHANKSINDFFKLMRLFELKEYKKKTSSDVLLKPQTKLLIGNCLIGSLSCYARQVNFLYA